ncbi:MAG: FISUMP domain-containing protein [Candidatus Zixiibacteriota bacterium]
MMNARASSTLIIVMLLLGAVALIPSGSTSEGLNRWGGMTLAAGDCCQGRRGNVDGTGIIDLVDLSSLVNYLQGGGFFPPCLDAANVNGVGIIDLADLSSLVNYLTTGVYIPPDCSPGTVTDIDGYVYKTVKIGSQIWMAENLRVRRYRNGDSIPNVTDAPTWVGLTSGAYCNYDNDSDYVAEYGRLYNWYAVTDARNIAPDGWHVASDSEWLAMMTVLGGNTVSGGKLKESGYTHWLIPNLGASNSSGFTALPEGTRYAGGNFGNIGYDANYWTSTEFDEEKSWGRGLSNYSAAIYLYYDVKVMGMAVRCVKDQ